MWGDRYERPEGTGKAPMESEAAFMQVISDMLASQRTISQSLAQVAERLAMVDIPGTQAPHAAQGNSGAGSRPQTPTRTYTSSSRIPRPWFPSFQSSPAAATQQSLAQRLPTQVEDIAEYKREYAALGRDFHQDMTLVEYCGLRSMNHPREPQRGGQQQQQGHNIDFIQKVGKLTIPSFDRSSKCTDRVGVQKLDMTAASDSCAFEGQLDGRDDSACPSSSPSGNVEDSTLQHTGDTCEDSYVLALRHDEIGRLDDLPMGVDMASRKSCMEDDELPMMSEPHFSSSQSYMLATTHEDISGIPDMVEEPCGGIVHKGHMDLQTQEERYGLEIVDLTHTYQYEESESPLLEIPLMDQVAETDSLLGHLLPGSIYSDDDTLLIGRDDHITCLDTSVWDPGADDISRVSAQEDTAAHTGYSVIQMGVAVGDGVQWPTGGLSSIVDSGQFSALSFEECVVEDSIVDTSSEEHEVEPQRDCDQESRHWTRQLKVSEDMIMAATRCIDDTHALVAGYCWRASMAHDSSDRGLAIDDFHTLMERVTVMRADYQQLLMDRDYLLEIGEMYHRALREQELEVDRLTRELVSTRGFLEGTQTTLQESRLDELLEKTGQRCTISISAESQICSSVTLLEDIWVSQGPPFMGSSETIGHTHTHEDSRARGSYEDAFIFVPGLVDIHTEVDPAVHLGHMMMREMYSGIHGDALDGREETHLVEHGDSSPLQQHIVLGDHLHNSSNYLSDDGGRVIGQQFVELSTVVPDSWSLGDYSPWVLVDEILVQSWGLTKAYDTFQSYSWVQIFMIAFLDTFIIDNRIGGARQWQGTWRVGRLRPPDRSVLIAYSRIGVDHQGQTVEFLGVMESILGHGTEDNSEVATYSDSHWDEGGQISTVTSRAHQQLVGIGSDELPNLTWDPGDHWVKSLFHLMRIQEWRVQYGYLEETVMIRVEQHQQDGPCQRLAWDPGITGLGISLIDGVEFRVEWLLGELTEILWPLIILLIRSMWVSCVVSTWRDHILRGVYLVSHRWIWDPGIICSWIQLLLEDKQYFGREDCNVPILGHYNITTFQSVMPARVAR
jgi:hypothetical protein